MALVRDQKLLANPKSQTVFAAGDRLGVIGEREQIEAVRRLVEKEQHTAQLVTGLSPHSTQRLARRLQSRPKG